MRTLLLDNTFFPVKIISWQRAVVLLLTNRAEVVVEYDDRIIRSVNFDLNLPKILRLYRRHKSEKRIKFSRQNVFIRDDYTCHYCYRTFKLDQLTLDHVTPLSKGGEHSWANVVTSCAKCNCKKGSKTLREVGFKLLKEPHEPNWSLSLHLRLKPSDPPEWQDWFQTG